MKQFMVDSPTRILLSRNKKTGNENWFDININKYRNIHWSMLAKSKKIYKDIMIPFLMKSDSHLERMDKVEIIYQIITNNKKKFDSMNVISIIDKYFQDVLVDCGIIKDDSWKFVKRIIVHPVIVDKELPERIVRITVKEY